MTQISDISRSTINEADEASNAANAMKRFQIVTTGKNVHFIVLHCFCTARKCSSLNWTALRFMARYTPSNPDFTCIMTTGEIYRRFFLIYLLI
jgi:hypothetical protein